jgi:hypothetical protein
MLKKCHFSGHIFHILVNFCQCLEFIRKVLKIIMQSHHRVRNATLLIALLLQVLSSNSYWQAPVVYQATHKNIVKSSVIVSHKKSCGWNWVQQAGYSHNEQFILSMECNVIQPGLTYQDLWNSWIHLLMEISHHICKYSSFSC